MPFLSFRFRFSLNFNILKSVIAIVNYENSLFESKKHFFEIQLKKKFLWIEQIFLILIRFLLFDQISLFKLKKIYFDQKTFLSQRNLFFDWIEKKIRWIKQIIIQNSKNSKLFKPSEYQYNHIWTFLKFGYFEGLNSFEFLKFWIIVFFGRWDDFEFVTVQIQIQFQTNYYCPKGGI